MKELLHVPCRLLDSVEVLAELFEGVQMGGIDCGLVRGMRGVLSCVGCRNARE